MAISAINSPFAIFQSTFRWLNDLPCVWLKRWLNRILFLKYKYNYTGNLNLQLIYVEQQEKDTLFIFIKNKYIVIQVIIWF